MPKVHNTRARRANKLLKYAEKGPDFSFTFVDALPQQYRKLAEDEARRQYQQWADSCVVGPIVELIPELKKQFPQVAAGRVFMSAVRADAEFKKAFPDECTYPKCKCIVSTSTSQPVPDCPKIRG